MLRPYFEYCIHFFLIKYISYIIIIIIIFIIIIITPKISINWFIYRRCDIFVGGRKKLSIIYLIYEQPSSEFKHILHITYVKFHILM
jgi:hypothetical protein